MEQNKQMMFLPSLASSPSHSQILSHSCGGELWREIGSGLGTRLAILVYLMWEKIPGSLPISHTERQKAGCWPGNKARENPRNLTRYKTSGYITVFLPHALMTAMLGYWTWLIVFWVNFTAGIHHLVADWPCQLPSIPYTTDTEGRYDLRGIYCFYCIVTVSQHRNHQQAFDSKHCTKYATANVLRHAMNMLLLCYYCI